MLVWQGRDRNEWSTAIRLTMTGETATAGKPATVTGAARGPDPFALS